MIRRLGTELARRFRLHHETNPALLEAMALLGALAFPAFYAARMAADLPARYDDGALRALATALCVAVMLRRWWPAPCRPWFLPLAYLAIFQSLAFMMPFSLLQNQAAPNSIVNMVVAAVLVMLLADWANAVLMLAAGYAMAVAAYWLLSPAPQWPSQFLAWWAPLCAVLVAGGSIARHVERRAELARLRRLYGAMAGSIAHEVRNPLAQVRAALDDLAGQLGPAQPGPLALPAGQAQAAREALAQGQRAVRSGLQSVRMTLQHLQLGPARPGATTPVSARACVQAAVDGYAYEDPGQRARVVVEDRGHDFIFEGDPTAVELVLLNLLKNALYYVPLVPALSVRLSVEAAPSPCIRVRDNGPGIAPALRARLFEEFETAGKRDGTGLGLAFCRRVMHGLGGAIECRSQPGAGTEFILSFPRRPASPGRPALLAQGPQALALPPGCTVLVVDDQALNRASVRARLAALGLRVVEAEHGPQALALLAEGLRPDAILMDVNMPGPSGIEVTRSLRGLAGPVRSTPVLALTADPSPDTLAAARDAGMQDVLDKPLDLDRLVRTLGPLLEGTGSHPAPAEVEPQPALLEPGRLDELGRLGVDAALVRDAAERLGDMVDRLHIPDPGCGPTERFHALLGLSAELGAVALQARLRAAYGPLRSGGTLPPPGWFEETRTLAQRTLDAIRQRLEPG